MAKLLVVDDRSTNRELVRALLGHRGHQVIEARGGEEALDLAHAFHPDLVLTDILMPGIDGYQLARELRAAPDTAHTPIVFYTATYDESEVRPFADACGVARVVLKSADPQVLIQTVDEVLAGRWVPGGTIDPAEADRSYLRAVSAKLIEKTETLVDTEARFRLMADCSPVGIVFGDRYGLANYINVRLTEILETPADDLLGSGWLRCASDDSRDEVLAVIRGGEPHHDQHHYRGRISLPTGVLRWLTVYVQVLRGEDQELSGFIATVDDVTAVVEADQQRQAAERRHHIEARDQATARLDSLSRLAGGVAHDFNNVVGIISAFESLVSDAITDLISTDQLAAGTGNALLDDLSRIRRGGQRLTGLTTQLLTFGSGAVANLSALDLNQAVLQFADLIAPTLGPGVHLITDLAPGVRSVLAEPTNIAQLLLNLTMNASQAMPEGGTVTLATSNVDRTTEHPPAAKPGRFARLTVSDTGHGMAPAILDHAIEPFFTTKPQGKGTGLGLATVYGIINQLGGHLDIRSAPGGGTAVTIDLPTTDQLVLVPPAVGAPAGGLETILVAEDEEGIREIVVRRLTAAGYRVLDAANGAAALHLADQYPDPIDLLLSDVRMPGMRGDELAATLLERRPRTRVLFMSGYAGSLTNHQDTLGPGVTILPKPFTKAQLLAAVRTMLDRVNAGLPG